MLGANMALSSDVVLQLLDGDKSSSVSRLNRPAGGEIFVFDTCGGTNTDWRADGYRWKQSGTTKIPGTKPVVKKLHFQLATPNGTIKAFMKLVYSKLEEASPHYVVVQYAGDSSQAQQFPHAAIKHAIGMDTPESSHADLDAMLSAVRNAASGESIQQIPKSIQALSATLRVVHIPDLQIFNVTDAESRTHAVSLFSRETCTCPVSTTCCHITAAKRSVGLETTFRKPAILSILRKNSRKANDRVSGRKKPRVGDLPFVPAPDSVAATKESVYCSSGGVHKQSAAKEHDGKITENCTISDDTRRTSSTRNLQSLNSRSTMCDKYDLPNDTNDLNDNVINAAQCLLSRQYTDVDGLFDTVLVAAHTLQLPVCNNRNLIQIVHDNVKQHWFCVTNKNCSDGTLAVYCSMQFVPSAACLATIAHMFNMQTPSLTFRVMNVTKQKGSVDCGLFAIAYAEMLARHVDPCNFILNQPLMREHLLNCLSENKFSAFPVAGQRTVRRNVVRSTTVNLHCQCRSTYLPGDDMLLCNQCKEWYHKRCLRLTDEAFVRFAEISTPYVCPRCAAPNAVDAAEVLDTAIASPSKASKLTVVGDEVNSEAMAADEEDVHCALPNATDAAEILDTSIASHSSSSTLTAIEDDVNCAEVTIDEEEELKLVR